MEKSLIMIAVILAFSGGCYALFVHPMQIGANEGYEPMQLIHFSHKAHAGNNQIDCQHCYSGARSLTMAIVPSLNVCMGCHKTISEYGGEGDLAQGCTKVFYTAEMKELYAAAGWDEQQFKYTGKPQGVQWVRIHKLPDLTYFNHSQHVKVAGSDCQQCHNKVPKMEAMRQHAPLTMGWRIECYRTQKVSIECAKCHY